jgi:hypothetical protein
MSGITQSFGKHCSCHPQGEHVLTYSVCAVSNIRSCPTVRQTIELPSSKIHPVDGNCNVCRNVGQLPISDKAHTRNPKFYIVTFVTMTETCIWLGDMMLLVLEPLSLAMPSAVVLRKNRTRTTLTHAWCHLPCGQECLSPTFVSYL